MFKPYRRNGITLIELMIVFFLMGLLMTAIYTLMAKGFYSIRFSSHKMDTTQTSLTFLNRIFRELLISNYKYISIDDGSKTYKNSGDMLSFPSPYDKNNQIHRDEFFGNLKFYKYIFYYHDGYKVWKKIIYMGNSMGGTGLVYLQNFHFPDGKETNSTCHLADYRIKTDKDIEGPIASAYCIKSLIFTKNDESKSITIELEVIDPKNENTGLKPLRQKLTVIPKNN